MIVTIGIVDNGLLLDGFLSYRQSDVNDVLIIVLGGGECCQLESGESPASITIGNICEDPGPQELPVDIEVVGSRNRPSTASSRSRRSSMPPIRRIVQ